LASFFSKICITNNGLTEQTGGALFLDLPANMLGCLIMGMLASSDHPIPWFRQDHPLQKHSALIAGLGTGFCGCLTTFASWNAQMVRMIDGTDTELGPQVAPALFGYLIGICAACYCFSMGRIIHSLISSIHQQNHDVVPDAEEDLDEEDAIIDNNFQSTRHGRGTTVNAWSDFHAMFLASFGLPLLVVILMTCFLVGALFYEIPFYQEIVLEACVVPLGALTRWKLAKFNQRGHKLIPWRLSDATINSISWIPMGTLAANIIASVLSLLFKAISVRYLSDYNEPWISQFLPALETGFCGSLSTVSTFVKEIFAMERPYQSFHYASGSLILAMLLGLLIFSPVVRS